VTSDDNGFILCQGTRVNLVNPCGSLMAASRSKGTGHQIVQGLMSRCLARSSFTDEAVEASCIHSRSTAAFGIGVIIIIIIIIIIYNHTVFSALAH